MKVLLRVVSLGATVSPAASCWSWLARDWGRSGSEELSRPDGIADCFRMTLRRLVLSSDKD